MSINAQAQSAYRVAIAYVGEPVTFMRIVGVAPNVAITRADVTAVVRDYVPVQPVLPVKREGTITQGARHIIVLDDDLVKAGFPMPLRTNDKVIVRNETLNIDRVDPSKRGFAGATEVFAVGV